MKFFIMVAFLVLSISAFAFDKSSDNAPCVEDRYSLECTRTQADFWESLTLMADKSRMLSKSKQADQVQQYGYLLGIRYSIPGIFHVATDSAVIYNKKISDFTVFMNTISGSEKSQTSDMSCLQEMNPTLIRFYYLMPEIYDTVMSMAKINKVTPCELKGYIGNFATTMSNIPLAPYKPVPDQQ